MPASISRLSSAFSTSIDELDRMVKRTAGCLARNGVVSADTIASAVGIAAMRRCPTRWPCFSARTSCAHGAAVADDALGPVQHPVAFRGQAAIARAAIDQEQAQPFLQLLDTRRQRRLRHAARLGGAAEMPFPRQGQQEFELVDHAFSRRGAAPGAKVSARPPGRNRHARSRARKNPPDAWRCS